MITSKKELELLTVVKCCREKEKNDLKLQLEAIELNFNANLAKVEGKRNEVKFKQSTVDVSLTIILLC